jgi:metacaspase-1
MRKGISVLCVHGVGHGDADPNLEGTWTKAFSDGLAEWNPELRDVVSFDFLKVAPLFDKAAVNSVLYGRALANLLASGISYVSSGARGLFSIPDTMRWTSGMVAQWVSDE